MSDKKAYLGDGVYIDWDKWGRVVLTTEDGIRATNMIIFEDFVLEALRQYLGWRLPPKQNPPED